MKEKIPTSEWKVMEVLWEESNILASQVVKKLESQQWSDKTIKSLLSRLTQKGLIDYTKEGKSYRYYPNVSKEVCVKEERQAFVAKIYGGSSTEFITNFIKNEQLSKKDLDELRMLLENKEEKG